MDVKTECYRYIQIRQDVSRTMGRLGPRDIYIHHSIPFLWLRRRKRTHISGRGELTDRIHWNLRSSVLLTVRTVNVVTARHADIGTSSSRCSHWNSGLIFAQLIHLFIRALWTSFLHIPYVVVTFNDFNGTIHHIIKKKTWNFNVKILLFYV